MICFILLKTSFDGIYFKLEFDFRNRTDQVCALHQAFLLPEIVDDFLTFYLNISKSEDYKSAKKKLRSLAKQRGETVRAVDFYNSGIHFNKETFKEKHSISFH